MTYEILQFDYVPGKLSKASLLCTPNWFERNILRKQSSLLSLEGKGRIWKDQNHMKPSKKICKLLQDKWISERTQHTFKAAATSIVNIFKMFLGIRPTDTGQPETGNR